MFKNNGKPESLAAQAIRGGGGQLLNSNYSPFAAQKECIIDLHGQKKKGFTLAETLITLTILGVIAALAIPGIIRNYQDRATITRLKKTHAALEGAIMQLVLENGNHNLFSLSYTNPPNQYFYRRLRPYLNVSRECGNGTGLKNSPCYGTGKSLSYAYLRKSGSYGVAANDYIVQLKDGTILIFASELFQATPITDYGVGADVKPYIGQIVVDVNGEKGPNRWGYDIFQFLVGARELYWPNPNMSYKGGKWPPAKNTTNKNECSIAVASSTGRSCAYWILRHNNMDYKYKDVRSEW